MHVPLVVLEPPSGGTQRSLPPYILTLWWYLEKQIFSEVVYGVKRLRTTVLEFDILLTNVDVILRNLQGLSCHYII